MLDICLLGTGGMMPLPHRWLTSMMARCNGSNLLIDCGEGTQIALSEKGWSPKPIDIICFTHYHADHISGLPGLLLTIGNSERTEPVTLIGPKGLSRVVGALRTIAPELPFELIYKEIEDRTEEFNIGPYKIEAFRVDHRVLCYGYTVSIARKGRFDTVKAEELGIPLRCWSLLQRGESVEDKGVLYTPEMVIGPDRRGLKVCYCTDTRPVPVIEKYAKAADLFICEGMYGENGKEVNAREHKHMTMYEAAQIAKKAQPRILWLTHYSPSMNKPEEYLDRLKKIFPNTRTPKDGWSLDLRFDNE